MLWVDKHRPMKMDDLTYHTDVSDRLQALVSNPGTMPHLFFYGPSGSGKKTRIATVLRELYGPGAEKLKLDKRTFTTPTKRVVEINLITSNYHIELSPGDAGLNDRFVVQEVVKEMASNKNIISAAAMMGNGDTTSTKQQPTGRADFKTVVLMDCDQLSRQAQAALRRTMEKYATSCRLILCCNSQSKVIEPVRSRCLGIRVAAPTEIEVCLCAWSELFLTVLAYPLSNYTNRLILSLYFLLFCCCASLDLYSTKIGRQSRVHHLAR